VGSCETVVADGNEWRWAGQMKVSGRGVACCVSQAPDGVGSHDYFHPEASDLLFRRPTEQQIPRANPRVLE